MSDALFGFVMGWLSGLMSGAALATGWYSARLRRLITEMKAESAEREAGNAALREKAQDLQRRIAAQKALLEEDRIETEETSAR